MTTRASSTRKTRDSGSSRTWNGRSGSPISSVARSAGMPRLAADFIESNDAKALDASCLDAMPVIPAFINANGWGP